MAAEARRRTAIASSTYEAGRPIFFGNPKLPLDTEVAIFKSTVDPVYFSLGLWTCQGPAWTALSEGYSRLLRCLVIARWGSDQAFHIPLPAVHLTLMAPPLEHLTRRARLSLLCSITKAGPDELWAILQQEQTWFEAIKEDLHSGRGQRRQVAGTASCTLARVVCAVQAVHSMVQAPSPPAPRHDPASLNSTLSCLRLQDSFKEYHDKHTVQLTLWALFHRAQASLPTRSRISRMVLPCLRVILQKPAGLGAHLCKTHQRPASYRDLVIGTACKACGKEFWSTNRLLLHLRDARRCADTLRSSETRNGQLHPGIGRREWRRIAHEMDKLAPSTVQHETVEPGNPAPACTWTKQTYAGLCDDLLVRNLPQSNDELKCLVRRALSRFPLYQNEIDDVIAQIQQEVLEVRDDLIGDFWTCDTFASVVEVLQQLQEAPWPPPTAEILEEKPDQISLEQLRDGSCWEPLLARVPPHVTPHKPHFYGDWEAEWKLCSGSPDDPAVQLRLFSFLPESLQKAWLAALEGRSPKLHAPDDFWHSALGKHSCVCGRSCTPNSAASAPDCIQSQCISMCMSTRRISGSWFSSSFSQVSRLSSKGKI